MISEYFEQNGKNLIYLSRRKNGKKETKIINDFKHYFYILESEKHIAEQQPNITKLEQGFSSIFDENIIKVFIDNPRDIWDLRKLFTKTYEADLRYNVRYLIDNEFDYGDMPKFCFFDIEVDSPSGIFPEPTKADFPINSISFIDNNKQDEYITVYFKQDQQVEEKVEKLQNRITKKEVTWRIFSFNTEEAMLNKFIELFKAADFDFISGWNVDFFDLPYLITRCKKLNVKIATISPFAEVYIPKPRVSLKTNIAEERVPVLKGLGIFDLRIPYKKMNVAELESYALNRVGEAELKTPKLEYPGSLYELYRNDLHKFLMYNMYDVELCVEINNKVGVTKYFWELSKFIGCPLGDTMSNSRMGDIFALRLNKHKLKKALPSKSATKPETFEGALVLEPIKGLHKNVLALDLSKIYPSVIINLNFSPETVVALEDIPKYGEQNLIKVGNGLYFRKDKVGFTPLMLQELFKIENEKKKIMGEVGKEKGYDSEEYKRAKMNRQFVKDLRNSIYGLLSYAGFRLYVPNVGASVTYVGRNIISWSKEIIEKQGYTVIYGDTDSIYVKAKTSSISDNAAEGHKLMDDLNKSYIDFSKRFNVDNANFKIEFEKVYKSLIMRSKKFYDGQVAWFDGQETNFRESKGLETKRSDSSKLTKTIINDVLLMIHEGYGKNHVNEYLIKHMKNIVNLSLEEISVPKAFHKGVTDYDNDTAASRAAKYSNANLGTNISKASKPYFLYIKEVAKGYETTDCICFEVKEQVPTGFIIDYEKMIELLIANKIEKIYEAMNWGTLNILYKYANNKIDISRQATLI